MEVDDRNHLVENGMPEWPTIDREGVTSGRGLAVLPVEVNDHRVVDVWVEPRNVVGDGKT
jgi:hypothetical protein